MILSLATLTVAAAPSRDDSRRGTPVLVPAESPPLPFAAYDAAKRARIHSMLGERLTSYAADRECGAPSHADAELIKQGAVRRSRADRSILWTHVHKCAGSTICELAKNNSEHMTALMHNCNLCVDNTMVCDTQLEQRPMPTLCAERKPGRVQSGEPGRAQSGECPSTSTFVGSVSCSERRGMMATSSFMGQERFVDDHMCADELVHGIMLREPVDRLVSNTAFAQRRGWNASAEEILALVEPGGAPWTRHGSCTAKHCPIVEQTSYAYDNMYVRTLIGPLAMDLPIGNVTRDHLAAAKARLSAYEVVLILSEFDVQSAQLLDRFGWAYVSLATEKNAAPDDNPFWEFSDEQLGKLAAANALDYELYCFATHVAAARTSDSRLNLGYKQEAESAP